MTETIISDSASSASVLSDDSLTVDTSVSPDAVYTGLEDDESSQEGFPVSVEVSGTEEPVTVEREETEKQIVLNVTVTPPSVDVKSESPIVNVEAPVVNVEAPAAAPVVYEPPVAFSDIPDDGITENSSEEISIPSFIPYRSLSLDSPVSLLSISGESSDTIRSVLESLLGEYRPKTQTVTEVLSDGTENTYEEYVPGLAGMDWTWIASLAVFIVMIYCLFRLLGSVIVRV